MSGCRISAKINLSKNVLFWKTQNSLESVHCLIQYALVIALDFEQLGVYQTSLVHFCVHEEFLKSHAIK